MVFKKEGVKVRIVKTYEENESSIGTYRSVELLISDKCLKFGFWKAVLSLSEHDEDYRVTRVHRKLS